MNGLGHQGSACAGDEARQTAAGGVAVTVAAPPAGTGPTLAERE